MEKNEVIDYLEKMPANSIYSIATGQYIPRGFEYYKKNRLIHFEWEDGNRVLVAKVMGSSLYSVSISVEYGALNYKCTCPSWSPFGNCKHVVCAVVTVKNLINPNHFNIGKNNIKHREGLNRSFLSHAEPPQEYRGEKSIYSIVIEKRHYRDTYNISVLLGNIPLTPRSLTRNTPQELWEMVKEHYDYYAHSENKILKYLQKYGNRHPLFLKIGDKKIPAKWDSSCLFSHAIDFNVKEDMVIIKRFFTVGDDVCSNPYIMGNDLMADLKTGKLGVIKNKKGLHLWNLISRCIEEDEFEIYEDFDESSHAGSDSFEPIEIPIAGFYDYQLNIPVEHKNDIQFRISDEAVSPITAEPHYSMTIEQDDMDMKKMILRACCNLEGLRGNTTRYIFGFLTYLGNGYNLSSYLRAKKRLNAIIKIFLMLLFVKEEDKAKKIINNELSSNGDFYEHKIRLEAKRCLMRAFSSIQRESSRIVLYNNKWYLAENNKEREALLYTIPLEIFGASVFEDMMSHNEMTISADDLYRLLPALYLGLKEHNIPLFLKGKQVQMSSWDFSFDCNRESGIDWFEIKPEIRCSGDLIDESLLQTAFKQNGIVERENFIQILDSNSQEILKIIADISSKGAESKERTREIVRVPRLQILDWIYLRNMGVKVRLSKEDEDLIERLNRFEKIEASPIPENLKANLRHYQKEGYYWLSFLYEHRFGACLADDMGLGKTIQAISLMAGIREGKVKSLCNVNTPHLLVLPPSLLFNWQNEIEKFYPDLKLHFYTGLERSLDFKDCNIVLTTYGLVRRDIEKLKDIQFNVIIFDEAQAVKNIYADTTGAVRQLKGYFKLAMTGTPVENHIGEYYSILDLSLPGLLGEYDVFKSYIKLDKSPSLDLILRRTMPFVLRRTKEMILKELPPKIESDIYLELTDKQKILYKKTVEMVKAAIDAAFRNKTKEQANIIALTAILKLRQLCVSPRLIDHKINEPSPKIEFLIGKLKELMEEGHSALVFSQFTSFLDIVEEDLRRHSLHFSRLDGSTAVGKRKKLVEGFQNNKDTSIFLLSLKAGGQGLNLTRASYVFHLDPWWNPAVENQASDRAHRIGQKNKVSIMRILMRHTIEEKMMELKKKKLELYKTVMENSIGKKKGLYISKSDFDYLLGM